MSASEARAYSMLSSILEKHTGQTVLANRHWRIDMALKLLMRKNSIPDLQTLAALIEIEADPKLTRACVEAMVNNETSFFRDQPNFALLTGPVLDNIREHRMAQKNFVYGPLPVRRGKNHTRWRFQYWKTPKNGVDGTFRFWQLTSRHRRCCRPGKGDTRNSKSSAGYL